MNADSEEDVLSLLDGALKQCREYGGGDSSSVDSLSKYMACAFRVPLVDRALGMLGHGAPVLCNVMSAVMVDALTALLPTLVIGCSTQIPALRNVGRVCPEGSSSPQGSSSSGLGATRFLPDNAVTLRLSRSRLESLLQYCEMFCASGKADEKLVMALVDCILKTAASAPALRYDAMTALYRKSVQQVGQPSVSPFESFVDMVVSSRERIYDKLSPCSRLCIWRLRTSLLDEDLLFFTQEALQRPLQSLLSRPLDPGRCRNLVLGLALAPDILADARRRVHTWFLLSGAASMWKLRTELMEAVADVVSRPSTWGLADNLNPVRFALYVNGLQPWSRILKMPPNRCGLIELVNMLDEAGEGVPGVNSRNDATSPSLGYDSLWSLQLDFINWWRFALQTLFSRCDKCMVQQEDAGGETRKLWVRSREVAARYVCSVAYPTSRHLRQVGELVTIADRWVQLWGPAPLLGCCDWWAEPGSDNEISVRLNYAVECSKAAAETACLVRSQIRKRGRAERSEAAEAGNKKMKQLNKLVDRPPLLQKWFADFRLACSAWDGCCQVDGNNGCRDVSDRDQQANAWNDTMTKPGRFSDLLFNAMVASDSVLLEQELGFVLLLIVAFGTRVEVDYKLCTGMGSWWLDQPDGSEPASLSRPGVCTREPQHRTEAFTEAWCTRFWQQARDASLQDWVKGGANIFDVLDGRLSWADNKEAAQPGGAGGELVVMLVVEFVKQLWSRLMCSSSSSSSSTSKAEVVITLQDLRKRFDSWAGRSAMSQRAFETCSRCIESLDQNLSRRVGGC